MVFVFLRPESPAFFSGIKGKQKSKLSVLFPSTLLRAVSLSNGDSAVKSFLDKQE